MKNVLKISFRENGADSCLEVSTPRTPDFVAALTESLRATHIRAKVQFTVRKPERWLAQLRLTENDGTPLSPLRAQELLRTFQVYKYEQDRAELESCNAA